MGTGGSKDSPSPSSTQNHYVDFAPGTPQAKNNNNDRDSLTVHVPTMFRWPYSGRRVFIVGTFNNWKEKIPMTYNSDENSFVVILNVSVGKHLYRFIVDNEYKTDPNSPTEKDDQGYMHNVITIAESQSATKKVDEEDEEEYEEFDEEDSDVLSEMSDTGEAPQVTQKPSQQQQPPTGPYKVTPDTTTHDRVYVQPINLQQASITNNQQQNISHQQHAQTSPHHHHHHHHRGHSRTVSEDVNDPQQMYTQIEHFFEEDKKNPPLLPPHLRYTVLNTTRKSMHDPALLPLPLHVTVNHAYFSDREAMNVIGVTQRYRDKYSTAVLYKPKKVKSQSS